MTKKLHFHFILFFVVFTTFFSSVCFGTVVDESITSGSRTTSLKLSPTNFLSISISGIGTTGTGSVSLERSFDLGSNWRTVTTYTSNSENALIDYDVKSIYSAISKDFTSGTISVRLSNGR